MVQPLPVPFNPGSVLQPAQNLPLLVSSEAMSIYNTPHVPRPVDSEDAGASLTDASSAQAQAQDSEPPSQPPPPSSSSSSAEEATAQSSTAKSRRRSLPFSFAHGFLFQSSTTSSSTKLAPSTAEGKPIPLAGDCTSAALQKLNSTNTSIDPRHRRYAKSTGAAQRSTYSQPVIVRTYSGHSQAGSQSRYRRQTSRRVPLSASTSGQPTTSSSNLDITTQRSPSGYNDNERDAGGGETTMPHQLPKKSSSSSSKSKPRSAFPLPLPWSWTRSQPPSSPQEEVKLPPLEAFSFKSFLNDAAAASGGPGSTTGQEQNDISADLDRIAEICARSRYSLSNQYEVHVAPHGSGASFVSSLSSSSQQRRGRVLQPDGEESGRRRGNANARRKSLAYGTLETIMSSSRSCSEEGDGSKKKGAKEVVDEVRGRGGRRGKTGGSGSSAQEGENGRKRLERKRSASFANAIMDSSSGNGSSSREEGLLSEIALPRVSGSHLGVRTSTGRVEQTRMGEQQTRPKQLVEDLPDEGQQDYYTYQGQNPRTSSSTLFGSWLPWQTQPPPRAPALKGRRSSRNAEGRLRELLKAPSEGRG